MFFQLSKACHSQLFKSPALLYFLFCGVSLALADSMFFLCIKVPLLITHSIPYPHVHRFPWPPQRCPKPQTHWCCVSPDHLSTVLMSAVCVKKGRKIKHDCNWECLHISVHVCVCDPTTSSFVLIDVIFPKQVQYKRANSDGRRAFRCTWKKEKMGCYLQISCCLMPSTTN